MTSQTLSVLKNLSFVEASLNYLELSTERPTYYIDEPPADIPRDNASYENHTLPIHNARSLSHNFSLDRQGFMLVQQSSRVHNFYNEDDVRNVYYPEAEALLQAITGATKVIVFDHNIRSADRSKQGKGIQEPVGRVHNDFTDRSGYSRARIELAARGIEADSLLQHRFSIVNVWRPIAEPVQSSPLAVCDAQTIASTDLVARDLVYRDRIGETYAITYNPAHQWFYFPQMKRDEALLIKCFDSAGNRARFTAHTAFDDPTSVIDAPPRESIELRSLVFYSA